MDPAPPPDATLRYFCMVMPTGGPSLGFDYLEALHLTGLGVKACPIGPAFLMSGPWPALMNLFVGPGQVAKAFVNVVCAPPDLLMGQALREVDVKPPSGAGPLTGEKAREEVVYKPQTAISGLFTVGVPNIAITAARPRPPSEHEITALLKYDAVITPSETDAMVLKGLGVVAIHMPPEKDQLARLIASVRPPE